MKNVMKILSKAVLIAVFGIALSFLYKTDVRAVGRHSITVTVNDSSLGEAEADVQYADPGATVNLSAREKTGGRFDCWYSMDVSFNDPDDSSTSFEMPDEDVRVVAEFVPVEYTVTYVVEHGKWNDNTTGNKTETVTHGGHLAQIPAVGSYPDGGYHEGDWGVTPTTSITITEDKTYTYAYVANEPDPPAAPARDDDDDDDHHSHHSSNSTAPAPSSGTKTADPNASISNGFKWESDINSQVKIGPQIQGPAAQAAFLINKPAGWKAAFTFNLTVDDKADYSFKYGNLSFEVPTRYQKEGRQFALLAIEKDGNVILYRDNDEEPNRILAQIFGLEGYAFELIYTD